MSPAFIKGVREPLPAAQVTHSTSSTSSRTPVWRSIRRAAPGAAHRPHPQGRLRWTLLKRRADLSAAAAADLDALIARHTMSRTARAWIYKQQLRHILGRKQINLVRDMLAYWCGCVMRSKLTPMKDVAALLVRRHLEGIVAWTTSRQTNGFLEAINGLFQAAKRKARGYGRFQTMRVVIFLVAGNLDFSTINAHAA